jgi:hypothetical protein
MSVRRSRHNDQPVTLEQANAITPMTAPADATAAEKRDFYQRRADMYRRVAETDRDHYWEALACAGLEQETADKYAQE